MTCTAADGGCGLRLTRGERRRLDFTDTTVVEARWVKYYAAKEGVRDWEAHFDPSLTVAENRRLMRGPPGAGGSTLRELKGALVGRRVV